MSGIEDILKKQREFFRSGRTLPAGYRKECLERLKSAILEMDDEISCALKTDLGKNATEAYMTETGMVLSEISHTVRHVRKWSRRRRTGTPLAQFPARSFIVPEPYGNVLIMSPWNYPFLLCISPLVSAVAAGNTAVVKPSAYSPATSAVIRELIGKVFPEEHVAVIEGGREVNADLLEQKFDYIFFTGSKNVGRLVMEKAAAHLTPVTLELGGKSPVIVAPDTAINVAAARTVFGKFLNCGQTCVAPDYILVHESIAEKFIGTCISKTREMLGDNPIDNPEYGKIVNRKHFDRLSGVLQECDGHIVYSTGCDAERLKIGPAIIRLGDIGESWMDGLEIMQEEIFGPLMPVITWKSLDDVIRYIDSRPRPLAAYIFTEDGRIKEKLLSSLHFGGGCINDTIIHLASDKLPFGGVGESGMGHYHGSYGFETFSHLKSIVDKPLWLDLPMRYRPYTALKDKLIRMFLK